jgi:predicted CoA-binding protein
MSASLDLAIATLTNASTLAVVGLSRTPGKPAHDIPLYMAAQGWKVVGVNPGAVPAVEHVEVVDCIENVSATIDILNVFRPTSDTDAIIDQAILRHADRGDVSCIWLQSGITSREGARKCAEAGITYIDDTCIYVVRQYLR